MEVHSVQSTMMGEISTCGQIIEVHSVQFTMMGDLNVWVDYGGSLSTVYNDGDISTCG